MAVIVLPVVVAGVVAALEWRYTWQGAARELSRSADAAAEYSLRVLDAHRLAADRVNDLLRGLSDAEIRAREKDLHEQLRDMLGSLPLVQTVFVLDRDGVPLLTANVYPVPRNRNSRDREWMRDLARPDAPESHISKVYVGRFDDYLFFAVSRRRSGSGNGLPADAFDGVINISVNPNQIAPGFADFTGEPNDVVSLIRTDGEILARRPFFSRPLKPVPVDQNPFMAPVVEGQERATFRATSPVDGVDRLAAMRRLDGFPVYALAAREASVIKAQWREQMFGQFAFGLPALLLLWVLAALAYRNAHKASHTRAALAEESMRRAAAEAAQAAAEAAQAAEANFRAVFETGLIGMAILETRTGRVIVANDHLLSMTGHSREDLESGRWTWYVATAPEFHERHEQALEAARATGKWEPYEQELVCLDGKRLPVRVSASLLLGKPGQLVLLVQDISKQREADARRTLMMREVEHRTKNMMAVVQSTLRVGASTETDAKALAKAVGGRIDALMRAQRLLSQSQWLQVDLGALLDNVLETFQDASGSAKARIRLDGPTVELSAATAQAMTLVVHELATNAVKYGSLSVPVGRVLVNWSLAEGDMLHLIWTEEDGPNVQPPERKGFGSRLIEATVQHQLGGTVAKRWNRDGLICELSIPVSHALAGSAVRSEIEVATKTGESATAGAVRQVSRAGGQRNGGLGC